MRVVHVAGTRANFIKVSSVYRTFTLYPDVAQFLVEVHLHARRDFAEADRTFLSLPQPDFIVDGIADAYLPRIAKIASRICSTLKQIAPDCLLIYGDVDSTIAAAIAGARAGILTMHVEAGLRNGVWDDNEELNRIVADHISQFLAVSDPLSVGNLVEEGISETRMVLAGNTIVDTLAYALDHDLDAATQVSDEYVLCTLHRDINLNVPERLEAILDALTDVSEIVNVVFAVQPKSRDALMSARAFSRLANAPNVVITDPVPYQVFVGLLRRSACVITDSSTLQDETTFLGVPCLTCLDQTHRASTIALGTNTLVGADRSLIFALAGQALMTRQSDRARPWGWDGKAGHRIAEFLLSHEKPQR